MTRSGRAPPGGTRRLGRAVLAYLVVLIRLCGAETAIEHDELGGAVGILDGCDTAEVRPPAHPRDEIGTRGCDSHRALPQGHGGRGALNMYTTIPANDRLHATLRKDGSLSRAARQRVS